VRLTPRKKLLVMCDDLADPLWIKGGREMVYLDDYPLSDGLKGELRAWAKWHDDVAQGNVEPDEDWSRFDAEGLRLWRRVVEELGADYKVGFFSETLQEPIWELDAPEVDRLMKGSA
jgi:hypothetical protein